MIGVGDNVAGAVDGLEGRFDFFADFVNGFEIGAEDFDADIGADAGGEHFDAVDDGLGEDVAPAGNLKHLLVHFVIDEVAFAAGLAGPEEDVIAKLLDG